MRRGEHVNALSGRLMVGVELLLLLLLPLGGTAVDHPEDFANPLAGAFTDEHHSTGNTLPLISRPWGFNHWSAETKPKGNWWFRGQDHDFYGLRLTHQPSPWIGDWGHLSFGPRFDQPQGGQDHMYWEPRGAIFKPYVFDAVLGPHSTRVRLTPTDHGAVFKVSFPARESAGKGVCFRSRLIGREEADGLAIKLESKDHNPENLPRNFVMHIRAELGPVVGSDSTESRIKSVNEDSCFEFGPKTTEATVWIASSLISAEQATLNLAGEVWAVRVGNAMCPLLMDMIIFQFASDSEEACDL